MKPSPLDRGAALLYFHGKHKETRKIGKKYQLVFLG